MKALDANIGATYIEPFCGALGVASKVTPTTNKLLADANRALIELHKHVQRGGPLPDVVTDDEFDYVKSAKDPNDWRTAYFGFGLSFGGNFLPVTSLNTMVHLITTSRLSKSHY